MSNIGPWAAGSRHLDASPQPLRIRVLGVVLLTGMFLSACATPPVVEFRAYRDAFSQAQDSARVVIADFASTKGSLEKFNASVRRGTSSNGFNQTFDPAEVKDRTDLDIIAVRLLALDTIAAYNEAMLALVEGKRGAAAGKALGELGSSAQTLAKALGASIPGLGGLLPVGQSLVSLAQQEGDRQAFIDGLRKGQVIVTKITDFLINDTKSYFRAKANLLAEVERNKLKDEAAATATLMVRLVAGHKAPAENAAEMTAVRDRSAKRLAEVLKGLEVNLAVLGKTDNVPNWNLPFGTKATLPPYGNLAESQMAQFVATLNSIDEKRAVLVEKLASYRALLTDYVLLLRKVRSTIIAAAAAPERRQDLREAIKVLVPTAVRIKDAIPQIKGS